MDLLDLEIPSNMDTNMDTIFEPNVNNDNSLRFSIINLEKDVAEYMQYRAKYYFYNTKLKKSWLLRRSKYKKQEKYYYNLYINKMKYLEETYRRTNNYTKYHAQLENLPHADIINENGVPIFG
jgi:hypothetical protein